MVPDRMISIFPNHNLTSFRDFIQMVGTSCTLVILAPLPRILQVIKILQKQWKSRYYSYANLHLKKKRNSVIRQFPNVIIKYSNLMYDSLNMTSLKNRKISDDQIITSTTFHACRHVTRCVLYFAFIVCKRMIKSVLFYVFGK